MSKRSGEFVTLRDLVEEVGVDAARYFFLMRRADSQLVFDVDLAKKQTDENPVFYVQMAHARLSGIFRIAEREPASVTGALDPGALPAIEDTELLKKLAAFPDVVEKAAREREPHRITVFLHELAGVVHGWYHRTRTVGEAPDVERARLLLARATRIVLANGLSLLGLSAPDRMSAVTLLVVGSIAQRDTVVALRPVLLPDQVIGQPAIRRERARIESKALGLRIIAQRLARPV